MNDQKYVAAIEISSSKIIGAVGRIDSSRRLTILAVEQEECLDIVRYGIIQNLEEVSLRVQRIIGKLNRNKLVSPREITGVFVGLSGRSMQSVSSDVKILFPEQTEITDEVLDRLREDALTNSAIHSRSVVDVIPRSYVVDKMETKSPKGSIGRSVSAIYDIIVCRQELTQNLKRALVDKVGLSINKFIVTPVAAGNLILTDEEKRLGCMLVDFGAETTTVCIYCKGSLNYYATIPLGGRNITRDITSLSVLEERAEDIKKNSANARRENQSALNISGLKLSDVSDLVAARAEEIVTNVIQQITYAGLNEKDLPAGIICIGAGSNLRGIMELIENQSGLNARMGHLPSNIEAIDLKGKKLEAIQVASILYAGAGAGDYNCLELPPMEEDPTNIYDTESGRSYDPNENVEHSERRPKKGGFMENMRNKFSKFFAPPTDEDESELD